MHRAPPLQTEQCTVFLVGGEKKNECVVMTDELKALGGAERAPSCRMQLGLNPESCPQAPDVRFHLQGARFMAGWPQETLYRLQGPEGSRPPCWGGCWGSQLLPPSTQGPRHGRARWHRVAATTRPSLAPKGQIK